MKTALTALLPTALALASLQPLHAAHVDVARNAVKAGRSSVRAGSSLAPDSPIATGRNSKTQVSLGANGSVLRAGSKTEAVLRNETDLALRQGVMLASSGKRTFGREAVSVETPETKSTVRGTMLVAYQPRTYIKITCIEGQVTVKLKALAGEFVALEAGQMVIINPAEKRLPQEVEVDLDELVRTSALLGPDFPELASAPRLANAVDRQARGINQGDAVRTPLVLTGAGLEVILSDQHGINARVQPPLEERTSSEPRAIQPSTRSTSGPSVSRPPVIVDPPPVVPTGPEYIIDGTTTFSSLTPPTLQTPGFPLITGQPDASKPTIWEFSEGTPSQTPELLISGDVTVPSSSVAGDVYLAGGILQVGGGDTPANVQQFGTLGLDAEDSLNINSARISTASNGSSGLILTADRTLGITNSQINQSDRIEATAPAITVDRSKLTAGNNGLRLNGGSGGITITNSSELRSLATAAGIVLQTNGSPIAIRNSLIDATDVLIDSSSPSAAGLVEITNSTINADTIRARAFSSTGANADALRITNSTFNANTVKFYAEGASKLVFDGNVNVNLPLSVGRAIFAGRTVEVRTGGLVRVDGNLDIFRDNANYDRAGFGNISVGGQRTDQPFDARPGF